MNRSQQGGLQHPEVGISVTRQCQVCGQCVRLAEIAGS